MMKALRSCIAGGCQPFWWYPILDSMYGPDRLALRGLLRTVQIPDDVYCVLCLDITGRVKGKHGRGKHISNILKSSLLKRVFNVLSLNPMSGGCTAFLLPTLPQNN